MCSVMYWICLCMCNARTWLYSGIQFTLESECFGFFNEFRAAENKNENKLNIELIINSLKNVFKS